MGEEKSQMITTDVCNPDLYSTNETAEDLVLPSVQFLRTNDLLKRQVDRRLQQPEQDD